MASFSDNARVTEQIMDYYVRYGQNRDLEKFFRLRANTTRSSSDGSLPVLDELDRREKFTSRLGKSMENLSTLRKQEQEKSRSQELLNVSGGSGKSGQQKKSPGGKEGHNDAQPQPQPKQQTEGLVVKETRSEKKTGRNFNFNLESVIEIKLPPAPAIHHPIVISPTQAISVPSSGPIIREISFAGTQTMPEARSVEQQTEEPIRPILKPKTLTANLNPEETIDTTRDLSPVSSVASNKQKLEWDSLGDIGYDSNDKFYFCGAADLNETEKRCLQKYFAKKGLNFDEKIVVVKNVQTPKKQPDVSKENSKAEAKQKWQDVYHKYKEKYPNPSEISMSLMNPDAQSTPKVALLKEVPQKPVKSTQTSLVKILSKAIQAEQIDTSDKLIGTETFQLSRSHSSNTNKTVSVIAPISNCDQGEVAASFEFFSSPPSANESNSLVHQSSAGTTLKTSPEVTTSSSSSSAASTSSGQQQLSTGDHARRGKRRETYNFEEELRLGMTLYNTICESRSLPVRVKQSLIDKIFSKMVKNDPKRRTKEQLLKEGEQFKRVRGVRASSERSEVSGVDVVAKSESSSGATESCQRNGSSAQIVVEGSIQVVIDKTSNTLEKEDSVVKNLEELSIKSNEARNPVRQTLHPEQSATSSQQTLSSRQESIRTAKPTSQTTPAWTAKSSLSGIQSSDDRIRKAMSEYLKPMTHSEVDYANQQDLRRSLERAKERRQMIGRDTASAPTTTSATSGDRLFELIRKEKQSQMVKLDKKIEHLKSMKLLLLEEQKAVKEIEGDIRTTYPVDQKFKKTFHFTEEKENLYANTEQRVKSAASAPVYTSVHPDTPSDKTKDETEYSSASRSESAWNSHYNMNKLIQNRSKLETPTSDESIATFIKNRKDKFIEKYERHRKRMFDDQNHIYTKPYSGRQSKQEHYSRLEEKYSVQKIVKPSIRTLPSSDVFMSSDSMSIPAANTLTNTTTHQYDIKSLRSCLDNLLSARPAATQTTGSILRTKPIFETQCKTSTSVQVPSAMGCQCPCNCPCRLRNREPVVPKRTEIVDGTQPKQDKQQQTKPNSIAYVITFQGARDGKKSSSKPSEKEQVYRTSSTDTSSADSKSEVHQVGTGSGNQSDEQQFDLLPLKEQFKRNRPTSLSRMKERQKCVNELNKLRSERNKQRKKLLLLTSDDSLKRCDVKQRLPPPPLAQTRIFSSKAIRENTRRQVRNLPEVLRKKEIEKVNNLKRKNLILRDKFNRNLQRKVLHGMVDLSNSVRVMQE